MRTITGKEVESFVKSCIDNAAIDMYFNQISITGEIPFAVTLPKALDTINTDLLATGVLHAKLQKGHDDIEARNVQNAKSAFAKFRENH